MQKSNYTKPKLCKAATGWYVHFRFEGRQKRYKLGLNRISSEVKRELEANSLIRVLQDKLKNGWNPFGEVQATKSSMTLIEAINFALTKKKPNISKKTFADYSCTGRFIVTSISDLGLNHLEIKETKRAHIRTIIERAKENRAWSPKAYNKHLNYLKAILSELIDWDIIDVNPSHSIKNLKTQETKANTPATPEEYLIIKNCLKTYHPNFYNYVSTIYHTGIRPKELLDIKLSMIDISKRKITLPPNITKTNKVRVVPINNHVLNMLLDLDIGIYPQDFYLFASYRLKGEGNRGGKIDFIPAPTHIKRDTATKRWKKIVKDGLGINVNMYSEKHRGANDKIRAGISIDALSELFGHTSTLMTKKYAKGIKEIYREEIINKSPEY